MRKPKILPALANRLYLRYEPALFKQVHHNYIWFLDGAIAWALRHHIVYDGAVDTVSADTALQFLSEEGV